jgi:hypothetical protein
MVFRTDSGVSPEQARDARARAWAFTFDCWRKKVAETTNEGEDGLKSSHEMRGGQRDLEKNAIRGAEGDRQEQTGKDNNDFVHC